MLGSLDAQLFYFVNKTLANGVFDMLMPWITELGSGPAVFFVAFVLLFFGKKARGAAILLFAGMTISYHLSGLLKDLMHIPRPFEMLKGVHLLVRADGFSFPSGHTVQVFMAATVLTGFFRRWRIVFFALAFLVGFSRVYVGAHFISDIIGGALVGCAAGWILVWLARDAQFSRDSSRI